MQRVSDSIKEFKVHRNTPLVSCDIAPACVLIVHWFSLLFAFVDIEHEFMTVWTCFQCGGLITCPSNYYDFVAQTPLFFIMTTFSRIISWSLNNECWRMSDWILINTKSDPVPSLNPAWRFRSSTDLIHFHILLSNIILADCFAIYFAAKATERWWYTSTVQSVPRYKPSASNNRKNIEKCSCAHFQKQ